MTDENLNPEYQDEFASADGPRDPDTDTGDFEGEVQPAIPVAEPPGMASRTSASSGPAPAPAVPPRPPKEQYWMLFANTAILLGCLTVWERAHVTGMDVVGIHTIGGALTGACAAYSVLASLVGLVRGGLNFLGTLLTGFLAVYFGVRNLLGQVGHEGFQYFGDLKEKLGFQEGLNTFLGQIGPGIYLNLIGGLLIFFLFFKAMFGGKKQEPETPRRRGRR